LIRLSTELAIITVTLGATAAIYRYRLTHPMNAARLFLALMALVQVGFILTSSPLVVLVFMGGAGCFMCVLFALLQPSREALRNALLTALGLFVAMLVRFWWEPSLFAPYNLQF